MKELSFEKMEEIQGGGKGHDTRECIEHAYRKNGWISTWAMIQTAFIPATIIAIAGACAIKNL
jgi:hypothetical protein